MLVVDSQIHLWGSNLPTNPAHRQITSYSAQDALRDMAEAGVDAAVIHPPGWDPDSDAIAVEAASQHPDKFAVLGKFPLDDPASASLIDGWKRQSGMLGLRFTFLQTPPADMAHRWNDGLALACSRASGAARGTCLRWFPTGGGTGGRASSWPQANRRPHGKGRRRDRCGRMGNSAPVDRASETSQRCGQGVGCAKLLFPALPLRQYSRPRSPDLRRLRSRPHVLGHRHYSDALLLERVCDPCSRRNCPG